jgi:hypothetical protein
MPSAVSARYAPESNAAVRIEEIVEVQLKHGRMLGARVLLGAPAVAQQPANIDYLSLKAF